MPDLSSVRLPALALVLALGACHASTGFPSLAQRPAEVQFAATAPAVPLAPVPGVADPATLRRIATLRADATHAHAGFVRQAVEAEHLARAAHGTPVGGEAWAAATTAMSELDAARSVTRQSLADLDALHASTGVAAAQTNDASRQATYAAVTGADTTVAAMLGDEDARIAQLHKTIED